MCEADSQNIIAVINSKKTLHLNKFSTKHDILNQLYT